MLVDLLKDSPFDSMLDVFASKYVELARDTEVSHDDKAKYSERFLLGVYYMFGHWRMSQLTGTHIPEYDVFRHNERLHSLWTNI